VIVTTVHPISDVRILYREARSLANAGYEVEVIGPPPCPDANAALDGVRLTLIPREVGRLRRIVVGGARLVPLLLRRQADVYHFHDPELLCIALLLRLLRRRVLYDAHEDLPEQIRDKSWIPQLARPFLSVLSRSLLRAASGWLNGIVAATEGVARGFRGRVVVVRNYPDISLFPRCAERDPAWITLIYVGGVSFSRGLREMVEVVDRLPGIRLHVVGPLAGSDERAYLEKQDPTRIVVEPWMQPLDVYERLGHADIGIALLHSIPRYRDALPVKLFEYMAAGLPVIASDFPLWRRILEESGAGLVVDPGDPQAIAAAIDRLVADPDLRRSMGERARTAATERYNWRAEGERLLQVYREALHADH
jgi:glycosyltransferase involved in cell wall biosynthesis